MISLPQSSMAFVPVCERWVSILSSVNRIVVKILLKIDKYFILFSTLSEYWCKNIYRFELISAQKNMLKKGKSLCQNSETKCKRIFGKKDLALGHLIWNIYQNEKGPQHHVSFWDGKENILLWRKSAVANVCRCIHVNLAKRITYAQSAPPMNNSQI